jgi:hypothetical protein
MRAHWEVRDAINPRAVADGAALAMAEVFGAENQRDDAREPLMGMTI